MSQYNASITLFPFYCRTRETITPPPAKKQKSEAKDNRKNVTKTSVNASATRIAKKTSPRINKSSLKSDGNRAEYFGGFSIQELSYHGYVHAYFANPIHDLSRSESDLFCLPLKLHILQEHYDKIFRL